MMQNYRRNNETMATLGDTLRTAREAKGTTCSEAAAATRIKIQHIEALESNDYSSIAAPAYAKGFIKLYGEYLGIDPKPLIQEYVDQYMPKERAPLFTEDPTHVEEATSGDKPPRKMPWADWKMPKLDIPWNRLQPYAPYVAGGIAALALLIVGVNMIVKHAGRSQDGLGPRHLREQGPSLLIQEPPEPYMDMYE